MILYAAAIIAATVALAWGLKRDLERAVRRQRMEAMLGPLKANLEAFKRALQAEMLPTLQQAARALAGALRRVP